MNSLEQNVLVRHNMYYVQPGPQGKIETWFYIQESNECNKYYRISLNSIRGHFQVGKLFEGFKILCTDFDHILEKNWETIQGGILFKGGY